MSFLDFFFNCPSDSTVSRFFPKAFFGVAVTVLGHPIFPFFKKLDSPICTFNSRRTSALIGSSSYFQQHLSTSITVENGCFEIRFSLTLNRSM